MLGSRSRNVAWRERGALELTSNKQKAAKLFFKDSRVRRKDRALRRQMSEKFSLYTMVTDNKLILEGGRDLRVIYVRR